MKIAETQNIPLITMRERGQVTIPGEIRKDLSLAPGSTLEAFTENGRIILEAKRVVDTDNTSLDKMLSESLKEVDRGETSGPFDTIDEWEAYLDSTASKHEA